MSSATRTHQGSGNFLAEVGLLSHTIVFRTSDAVKQQSALFGGHVLIHGGKAQVSGVELRGLGQQNFMGRYPIHFHHVDGASTGSFFNDSSVWASSWRSVVIHRTNDMLVSRNVAFDTFGHSFYLEDGTEMRNELSFNLAARTKVMGDAAAASELNAPLQEGIVIDQTAELLQPSDRAAAGFYIPNGNNRFIGNAASGGFAGFTFPSVPEALGPATNIIPLAYGVSHFDGNTAHSSSMWRMGGCLYAGGVLQRVTVNGQSRLRYRTGRTTEWALLRHTADTFNNTRTFNCTIGITSWGSEARVVNFDSYDNELLAQLFGSASVQSAVVVVNSFGGNTGLLTGYRHGFQFYDTDTQTVLSDIVFRGFFYGSSGPAPSGCPTCSNCALFTMTHSDEWTPQNMNATRRIFFDGMGDEARWCHADTGTLSSRNFNLYDSDGTATFTFADAGVPIGTPRMVGSAFSDVWRLNANCARNDQLKLWLCPLNGGAYEVAAINTLPNRGVRMRTYNLSNGAGIGETWFSSTSTFDNAQLTAPARVGWHHSFPSGIPSSFDVQALQVPNNAFVVYSFSLPPGLACSVNGWTSVANFSALMSATGAAYTTYRNTCFLRVPPTNAGGFSASGLTIPNQTWVGTPTPTTYFTVQTGCTSSNSMCQTLTSTLPVLP